MNSLTITSPDDWHVHFRDGVFLESTVPATAMHFSRALVMPNLKPALTSISNIVAYRQRIIDAIPANVNFTPYMTIYLNHQVTPQILEEFKLHPYILGGKLYPANSTTNSAEGPETLKELYPLFEVMQKENLVLQVHGEITSGDIFEREAAFIQNSLMQLAKDFPKLRIILEHISSRAAIDFVIEASENVAATITPHHLFYNRNHLLAGGVKPHYYCLPILKHETDQKALQEAALSGNPKFFAGTDSAPHAIGHKESACGCAGIFCAPYALAIYTQVFDELGGIEKLDAFCGRFGAEFYQLPYNKTEIVLAKKLNQIPEYLGFAQEKVVPIGAGTHLKWRVET